MPECVWRWLGRVGYRDALATQKELVRRRIAGEAADTLLLLEHPPVYTMGKVAKAEHVLDPGDAEVVETDRGGDVTFHGPGQLVGYPIVDLNGLRRDVKWYLEGLEEVMIRAVAGYGVRAGRVEGLTGAWVGDAKIGAIGVRVERWVTSHGFALNATTDLSWFSRIVPCGIRGKAVTSIAFLLGRSVELLDVAGRAAAAFGEVFGRDMRYESEGAARPEARRA
jgi:lipoate-protein ligase B